MDGAGIFSYERSTVDGAEEGFMMNDQLRMEREWSQKLLNVK